MGSYEGRRQNDPCVASLTAPTGVQGVMVQFTRKTRTGLRPRPSWASSDYDFNDDVIAYGAAYWGHLVEDYLKA